MRARTTKTGANVVRLAVSNPIATHQQYRDQDFEAVAAFADSSKALEHHATRWSFLDSMTRVAILTLGKSKSELIEMTAKHRDTTVTIAKDLGEAIDEAKLMLSFIETASLRTIVALANVYPDDDMPESPA
jgi:adenosyl cobinamide kinase/adenosyl cobinamide phosphate guanylyltransferase